MLVFQNDGILPIEGFTTFGMSAKPGSTNPIGKFGTGLKNAVAIILRLGGEIRVWRGMEEYVFYTQDVDFRGKTFSKVRMKRRKGLLPWRYESLPFTTELGKHWQPWMAFRELEANTRDEENGKTISTHPSMLDFYGKEGSTTIMVDCKEIDEAYANIDDIFLPTQEPVFENGDVRIYDKPSDYVYYRGMRVTDLRKPSIFTYEMKSVMLTEDRTSSWTLIDNANMMKALLECPDREIVRRVVNCGSDSHESTFEWDKKKPSVSDAWHGALSRTGLSPRFSTLRDNLNYGLGRNEDLGISMEVRFWEVVLGAMKQVDESIYLQIREQMVDEGWYDKEVLTDADEIANSARDNHGMEE